MDGHVCLSLAEKIIDDWLYQHGIAHEREPHYPQHESFNPRGLLRADWRIGPIMVEYFGLVGDPHYDAKMTRKIALAQETGIKLISIFQHNLVQLDTLFHDEFNSPGHIKKPKEASS
jgi:hypothetical protein